MAMTVRRVVTGHDENGRAVVASDEEIQPHLMRAGVTGYEIWSTDHMPVDLSDQAAALQERAVVHRHNYVGSGEGSVIRVLRIEPGAARFMHRTETLDYGIVLTGSCELELDDDVRVQVSAGDIVVQRGTIHAWGNNGTEPCVLAFILLDAAPAVAGGQEMTAHYPVA